eukprot:489669-Pelagomonas_calceolata.AAC.3
MKNFLVWVQVCLNKTPQQLPPANVSSPPCNTQQEFPRPLSRSLFLSCLRQLAELFAHQRVRACTESTCGPLPAARVQGVAPITLRLNVAVRCWPCHAQQRHALLKLLLHACRASHCIQDA